MTNRRGYTTGRDRKILAFVYRYRAATEEMLGLAAFSTEQQRANTSRVLRRLTRQGLLNRFEFAPGKCYYVLTRNGHRSLGLPPRVTRPFTEQSLPTVLAIAWHCVRTGLLRFTDAEFQSRYPDLWKPGHRASAYYLNKTAEGTVLGMFLVDRGATPRRIQGKLRRIVLQRRSLLAFEAIMQQRRFCVTVLTGTAKKQQTLTQHFRVHPIRPLRLEFVHLPELGMLLTLE